MLRRAKQNFVNYLTPNKKKKESWYTLVIPAIQEAKVGVSQD
jgi:hypothetical protein